MFQRKVSTGVLAGSKVISSTETPQAKKLGTINGVVIPVLLNILGIILYLRIGWSVGQAGWLGTLSMFVVGSTLTLLTVLSLSALVTGLGSQVGGGGMYFLISRALGPALGGAIGILFFLAFSLGACFYSIGFATEVKDTLFVQPVDIDHGPFIQQYVNEDAFVGIVGSLTLVVVFCISLAGAEFFAKVNGILCVIQFSSIFFGIAGLLFGRPRALGTDFVFTGPMLQNLRENALPAFQEDDKCDSAMCSWVTVFSIIFPAMTGIMEGANLSGELKKPAQSIPKGTLAAMAMSLSTYIVVIFSLALALPRQFLLTRMTPMQDVSEVPGFIFIGVSISAASSALNSFFGGSRVLQALAKDALVPVIGSVDEPKASHALVLTYIVAQLAVLCGALDIIAPVISSFFCMSYAITNISCLVMAYSESFEPKWPYWSRYSAALGALLNVVVMVVMDFWNSVLVAITLVLLTAYVNRNVRLRKEPWMEAPRRRNGDYIRKLIDTLSPPALTRFLLRFRRAAA